ncbi:MAG: type I secretion system permease/ATPase [Pseudomonadota bacterium]
MPAVQTPLSSTPSAVGQALDACRSSFVAAGFFSLFVNLLLLLPALYMLQVYDRVLTSGSESTLLMLTLIAVFLFMVMGGLEWVRAQILIVASTRLDELLGGKVFDSVFQQTLASGGKVATAQPLADLIQLRQFLTGPGLFAFFDAPWLPLYIAVMFLFHPVFGVVAVLSACVLMGLAIWNEMSTRADLKEANIRALASSNHTERSLRSVEAIEAMGMLPRLRLRWGARQREMLALQARASRRGGLISAVSKTFRISIQTLILGLGAWLAIRHEISSGAVIAGSILLGRALAPLDLMIGSWRGFLSAREAYRRLDRQLSGLPDHAAPMSLPTPKGELSVEKLVVRPPGAELPIIKGISLLVEPGSQLAILGPSAAGKSTLARALLGLYPPLSGTVRLDGAEITQWDREALGRHIGYLPQDVELLDGTASENIARFGEVDPARVVAAAEAAGVHQMILRLPEGYGTQLVGNVLSAGQRQRIGLARALYGDPQLIVLDEPNSNLDQDGEAALAKTLADLKHAGRTVVVVTHRRNILNLADKILLMGEGQIAIYGARDKVLAALQQAADQQAAQQRSDALRAPVALPLRQAAGAAHGGAASA